LAGAPLLEELSIIANMESFTLPRKFFEGGAPRLRRLFLSECKFSWMAIPFSATITHLKLDSYDGEARPPAQGFVDSFTQMPFLKSLHLSGFLPSIQRGIPSSSFPAASTASHLQDLRVVDAMEYLPAFSNLVRAPNIHSASFVIMEYGTDLDVTAFRHLASGVASSWRENQGAISRVKKLKVGDRTPFGVWFYNDDKHSTSQPHLSLSHLNYWARFPVEAHFPTLHEDFDISLLQELAFTISPSLTLDLIAATFGRLPKLREISVDGSVKMPDLLKLLSFSTELAPEAVWASAPTDALPPVNFPALSSIKCRAMDFEDESATRRKNISTLVSTIKARSQCHPIKRLSLRCCKNFSEAEKGILSSGVPGLHVDWDGQKVT
jgi:hypothetical protein